MDSSNKNSKPAAPASEPLRSEPNSESKQRRSEVVDVSCDITKKAVDGVEGMLREGLETTPANVRRRPLGASYSEGQVKIFSDRPSFAKPTCSLPRNLMRRSRSKFRSRDNPNTPCSSSVSTRPPTPFSKRKMPSLSQKMMQTPKMFPAGSRLKPIVKPELSKPTESEKNLKTASDLLDRVKREPVSPKSATPAASTLSPSFSLVTARSLSPLSYLSALSGCSTPRRTTDLSSGHPTALSPSEIITGPAKNADLAKMGNNARLDLDPTKNRRESLSGIPRLVKSPLPSVGDPLVQPKRQSFSPLLDRSSGHPVALPSDNSSEFPSEVSTSSSVELPVVSARGRPSFSAFTSPKLIQATTGSDELKIVLKTSSHNEKICLSIKLDTLIGDRGELKKKPSVSVLALNDAVVYQKNAMLHPYIALYVQLTVKGEQQHLRQVIPVNRLGLLERMFNFDTVKELVRGYRVLRYLDRYRLAGVSFRNILMAIGEIDRQPLFHKLLSLMQTEHFIDIKNIETAHVIMGIVRLKLPAVYRIALQDVKTTNQWRNDDLLPISEDLEPADPRLKLEPIELWPLQESEVDFKPRRKRARSLSRGYRNAYWRCTMCHKIVKGDGNRRAHVITSHVELQCSCPRTGCSVQLRNTYSVGHHLQRVHRINKAELSDDEKVHLMQLNSNTLKATEETLKRCFPESSKIGEEEEIRMKSEDMESRICRECSQVVMSSQGRRNHILSEHSQSLPLRCFKEGCSYSVKGWNALRSHLKRSHGFEYRSMDVDDAKNYLALREHISAVGAVVESYFPRLSMDEIFLEDADIAKNKGLTSVQL
ncbi:hypothetical protein QR680_007794 [Steinernema hermaphroditum]|uniref:C2H2-type domain-containing protein n=1 Tax=Steinernema hermaphroditum TaxID=289476 RepID=A0AA39IFU8_9BILA|nr:hypothetical protein QR680_007794 [Steinernema hermaphroditum]